MNTNLEYENAFLPKHYLKLFEEHANWIAFFEKNNMSYLIDTSTVASMLNANMIYYLLSFPKLTSLVQLLSDDLQSRLYIVSLYCKAKYDCPYGDIFAGDLKYQHYKAWRMLFSIFIKQNNYHCDTKLIHYVMKTIDTIFEMSWPIHHINLTLSMFYEWIVFAKKHHHSIVLCYNGHDFESFFYHVSRSLFQAKDDTELVLHLCKKFSLIFEGVQSFDILMQHFNIWQDIWNGERKVYGEKTHGLPLNFTSATYDSTLGTALFF